MSDDDLIRRGDALAAIQLGDTVTKLQALIRAIPYVDADPVCTCCGGTGITYQTEGRCACQGPDLTDPVTVHVNMLRGAIAKPTVEQIVHLYGSEAFQPMIDAATAKALEKACLAVSEHADWPEDEPDARLRASVAQLDAMTPEVRALVEAAQELDDAIGAPGKNCGAARLRMSKALAALRAGGDA